MNRNGPKIGKLSEWNVTPLHGDFEGRVGIYRFYRLQGGRHMGEVQKKRKNPYK